MTSLERPGRGAGWDTYHLRGPVRQLHAAVKPRAGAADSERTITFGPTGGVLVVLHRTIQPDGGVREYCIEETRRPDGCLAATRYHSEGGLWLRAWDYDEQDRPIALRTGKPGQLHLTDEVFHHSGGGFRWVRRVVAPSRSRPMHFRLPNSRLSYGFKARTGEIQTEYDSAGLPRWSVLRGARGRLGIFSQWDRAGTALLDEFSAALEGLEAPPPRIASPQWPGAGQLDHLRREAERLTRYQYNDQGREVLRRSNDATGGLWEELRTGWNDAGDPVRESASSARGRTTETVYAYEYDERRNWTRRVIRCGQPEGPMDQVSEERRTIAYY